MGTAYFGAGELHNNTQDCLDHVQDHRSVTGITYVKKNKRKDKKLLPFLRPGLNVIDSNGRAKKKAWCAWYAPRILCQCISMRMEEADEIRGKGLGFGCMSISPLLESEDDFFGLRFKSYVIKW